MFDEILKMVKDHLSQNPEIAAAIPADQHDALHQEIANHLANNATTAPATAQPASGGILGTLENAIAGGGSITNAIEGGLLSSLTAKFGLPPSITGAISGALPGLMQKFMQHKQEQNPTA